MGVFCCNINNNNNSDKYNNSIPIPNLLLNTPSLTTFDAYKYSTSLYESFNLLRQNIPHYINLLTSITSPFPSSSLSSFSSSDKELIFHLQTFMKSHEDSFSILKELTINLYSLQSSQVKWSEDIYTLITSHSRVDHYITLLPEINKKLNRNLHCSEYTLEQYYPSQFAIWHLLLEHKEKYSRLLYDDDYICGTIVTMVSNEGMFKTVLLLFKENKKKVEIEGINPVTGEKELISLNEKCFNGIEYKEMIAEGSYMFCAEKLNVVFKLCNGDVKEENYEV